MQEVPTDELAVRSVRDGVVQVQRTEQEPFDLKDLLEQYWHVSRCWANHELAVQDNMTFEVAVQTLRRVMTWASVLKGGDRLSKMAAQLLDDIVKYTEDLPEVNAAD